MILSTYQAAVECRGAFAPRDTCFSIMDDMRAGRVSQTFAPRNDPAAQVRLPAIIPASMLFSFFCISRYHSASYSYRRLVAVGDGRSSVRVLGKSDTTSWYRIWEAVMLVYSVCARKGKGGVVTGLGMSVCLSAFSLFFFRPPERLLSVG